MPAMPIREQRVERAQLAVVRRVAHECLAAQVLDDDVEVRQRMQDRADRREVRVPRAVGILVAAVVEVADLERAALARDR